MRGTHSGRRDRRAAIVARRLSTLLSATSVASSPSRLDRAHRTNAVRRSADASRWPDGDRPDRAFRIDAASHSADGGRPNRGSRTAGGGVAEEIGGAAPPAATLRSAPEEPALIDLASSARESPSAALRSALSGRFDLETPGARALLVVGVVAALVAVGFLWLSRPRPQPVPAADVRPSLAAAPPAPSTTASATVVVHVAGKVRHPGVVTLPAGARVTDAIKAAGGPRPGAHLGELNLARHVVDGEQILVGVGGQQPAPAVPAAPGGASGSAATAPGAQLDLNAATVEQFDQLPGVGPVLAQRLVEYRTQHGGFRSVDELQDVSGIGDKKYAELKDLVRV
jgi:competence protein ComEA